MVLNMMKLKKQQKIVKEYDNGKEKDVIENTIGNPIKRFWKTMQNKIKFNDIYDNITFHKIKKEKREYETDKNGIIKNKEDKGKLIDENVDIVSYTVKDVTTNNNIRKMYAREIIKEYPELAKNQLKIYLFVGIGFLIPYKVKITEIKEYKKTYDYKTKILIEKREVSTRSIQELV